MTVVFDDEDEDDEEESEDEELNDELMVMSALASLLDGVRFVDADRPISMLILESCCWL